MSNGIFKFVQINMKHLLYIKLYTQILTMSWQKWLISYFFIVFNIYYILYMIYIVYLFM